MRYSFLNDYIGPRPMVAAAATADYKQMKPYRPMRFADTSAAGNAFVFGLYINFYPSLSLSLKKKKCRSTLNLKKQKSASLLSPSFSLSLSLFQSARALRGFDDYRLITVEKIMKGENLIERGKYIRK